MNYQHRSISDLDRYSDNELRIMYTELKESVGDWESVKIEIGRIYDRLQSLTVRSVVVRPSLDWTWVLFSYLQTPRKNEDVDCLTVSQIGDRWFGAHK